MFPLKNRIVGGYFHGQKTAYSPRHFGADYKAKLEDGFMPFDGTLSITKGTQGGNIALITPDLLYQGNKIVIRCLHLDRFLVPAGHYQKGTKIMRTGNTGMGVDANGNVTSNANPYHFHLDISRNAVDLNNFDNFIDPEKFDWEYDTITSMTLHDFIVDGMPADERIAALKAQVKKYGDIINSPTDGIAVLQRTIKDRDTILDEKRATIQDLTAKVEENNSAGDKIRKIKEIVQ